MKYFLPFVLLLTVLFSACDNQDITSESSPHIQKFYFSSHKDVPGIENISFTVDSVQCLIYNTDSIAYDSNLTKLLPYIQFTGSPNTIQINGKDWKQTDSIDFSKPVSLYVLSQNKKGEATYTITLNQHKHNPDEITWQPQTPITLPAALQTCNAITSQNKLYLFVATQEGGMLFTSNHADTWANSSYTEDIAPHSIGTYKDHIYALSTDGTQLYRLENDKWITIANNLNGMTKVIGELQQKLWLTGNQAGVSVLYCYNGSTLQQVTDATLHPLFGIEGSATLVTPTALYLIGGRYNEQAQNCVISTDNGIYWTNLLNQSGKYAFTARSHANAVAYYQQFYLFGGLSTEKNIETTIFSSENEGYSWTAIPAYQQLPSSYTWEEGSCAVVFNKNIYLFSPNATENKIIPYKGRIRKADFIKQ